MVGCEPKTTLRNFFLPSLGISVKTNTFFIEKMLDEAKKIYYNIYIIKVKEKLL